MNRLWTMGVLLAASVASAAVPPVIPFQGRITATDGSGPLNGAHTVIFTLYRTAVGATADVVYAETQNVTFTDGAFSVSIGAMSPLMTSIFQNNSELHLGVHIGGDPNELRPLFRIGTAPYAMHAASADSASTVAGLDAGSLARAAQLASVSCPHGSAVVESDAGVRCAEVKDAYTKTEADGRFARFNRCYWLNEPVLDAGTSKEVTCLPGDYAIAGGCDGNSVAGTVVESFPGPSTGNYKNRPSGPWPIGTSPTDPNIPVIDRWSCRTTGAVLDSAYVLCCPGQ